MLLMNVAIVIVTFNRLQLLKECIDCALNQETVCTELVVVNNKSTDGTYEYLQSLNEKRIHCIHEKNNIGGAGGFHDGVKYAYEHTKCDWVLLIDDDAMISLDYLNNIEKCISDRYMAYAGVVYVNDKIDIRHRTRKENGAVGVEEYSNPWFLCDVATFCGLLISRKLIELIGYPRKDFFIWEDDTEYCYRIMKDSEILVATSAILNHKTANPSYKVENSIKDDWKWYYGFRNQLVMYRAYDKRRYIIKLFKLYGKAVEYKIKGILCHKQSEENLYNSSLRFDAIKDAHMGNMGKSLKY